MFVITSGWLIVVNYTLFAEAGLTLQASFLLFPAAATKGTPYNYNYNKYALCIN